MTITVKFKRLPNCMDLPLPEYATSGSSGMDIRAAVHEEILPFDTKVIPCGFSVSIPDGFEAQIRPRSGLAAKHGITIPNSPATIDSDYTGEIKIIITNQGGFTFEVEKGMRVAQMVFAPVVRAVLEEVDELEETERAEGGFGSTGVV